MSSAPALTAVGRPHPSSVEAERACLGAVLLEGAGALRDLDELAIDDLMTPAHREILSAMRDLRGRGVAVDFVTLEVEMRARGQLGRLDGGASYLSALPGDAPCANLEHHVAIVKDFAARRHAIALAAEIASRAHGDDPIAEILDEARRRIDRITAGNGAPVPAAAELVDRLVDVGDPLSTGLRTLDAGHRGGFRRGRLVGLGGSPGAAKTTTVTTIGYDWARAGVHVAVLAADECAADLLVRFGQLAGLERAPLEAGDPVALDRLRDELRRIPTLTILDGDDGATVEAAAGVLRRRPAGERAALIVDSLQTARAAGTEAAESPRARIDAVLRALRRASREGVVVVFTSELARAAYRSRDSQERIDDLAAGKESGSIEYAAQTLLVLRPVPDRVGEVDVTVPKNRGGDKRPFRLVVDFAHARVHETASPIGDATEADDPATELLGDIDFARRTLRENPGINGKEQLRARLKGMSKARQQAAIRALEDGGEIEIQGTKARPRLFLVDSSEGKVSPVSRSLPNSPGDIGDPNPPRSPHPFSGETSGEGSGGEGSDESDGPDLGEVAL